MERILGVPEAEWKQLEVVNIKAALKQTNGKVFGPAGAARLLGVAPTLFQRIKKAGIKATPKAVSPTGRMAFAKTTSNRRA